MDFNNHNKQKDSTFSQNLNHKEAITLLKDSLSSNKSIFNINKLLQERTGIVNFFSSKQTIKDFSQFLENKLLNDLSPTNEQAGREFGDVQTPPSLVRKVYRYLSKEDFKPEVLIEPTFGIGNFIFPAPAFFPSIEIIYGVELQQKNKWELGLRSWLKNWEKEIHREFPQPKIYLYTEDIFTHEFLLKEIGKSTRLLIIGNPPWVTTAELSAIGSNNMPQKSNFKKFQGLNALTGKSNFDISESILQLLLQQFSHKKGKIALLLKNTVIRNLIKQLPKTDYYVTNLKALKIDAAKEFGVSCEASLFVCDLGLPTEEYLCEMRALDKPKKIIKKFGWLQNKYVADIIQYQKSISLEGRSKLVWRQGVKHDCAKVMELQLLENGLLENRLKEKIELEEELLYPLLKGRDIGPFRINNTRKRIILTQKRLNEETAKIKDHYPKTWDYLQTNIDFFEKRKSAIYNNRPDFAIFGIGKYAFLPYKVAIAGMYKEPCFSFVPPIDNKPVMFDDTCYYIGFANYKEAVIICMVLNSPKVKDFLSSIVFLDAKRPYTKNVLMRINVQQLLKSFTPTDLQTMWQNNDCFQKGFLSIEDFDKIRRKFIK